MKMLFALGLVLVHALAIQASILSKSHPGNDIDALCAGKSIDLTTFSQLKELSQAAGASACSRTVQLGISSLVKLIESGKDDLCSEDSIYGLRAYYYQYLDRSGENPDDILPKPLKRFALAYGMQMSNLCKKNMVNVLSTEGSSLVDASDFEQLDMLIKDDGPVAQFLGVMGGPGEVFLPGDLIPFLKKHSVQSKELSNDKLVMQTATSDYIKQIQSACQHRFKPVYEPLMMPIVRLVNMGFNYKDEPLKCDLECPRIVHDVSKWTRIVFLCEALANVRIVEEKGDEQQGEGSSSRLVRIMTQEEADLIEGPQPSSESEAITDNVYTAHNKVSLGDEIYNESDKQLKKAIKSFKTTLNEEDILRKRVSKKGFELIKNQLKKGHFGYIFSTAWKGIMRKGNSFDSPTKAFVEGLNEIAEHEGNGPEGSVSMGINAQIELTMALIFFVVAAAMTVGILAAVGVIGSG